MKVIATSRELQGTSASRRLRNAGKVPGIVYGGTAKPANIELDHNNLFHALRRESFHSSILELEIDGKAPQQVLLRDVQMHPFKQQVLHIDFQRVSANEKINVNVPLHFINEDNSPAVKLNSAVVSHVATEIEIVCLPADLPEFITVDLGDLTVGHSVHVNDVQLPAGVTIVSTENPVIAMAVIPRGAIEEAASAEAAADEAAPAAAAGDKK